MKGDEGCLRLGWSLLLGDQMWALGAALTCTWRESGKGDCWEGSCC